MFEASGIFEARVGAVSALEMMLVKLVYVKALIPMFVTELPMVSEPVKPEQPSKAEFPMLVTELPMVSEPLRPEQ